MDWVSKEGREKLSQLVEMTRRLGRDPTFDEVDKDPSMPKGNDYAIDFGSFTNAVKEAHRIVFVSDGTKPPLPVGKKTIKEERDMGRKAISDAVYVIGALRLQKELGHFPEASDIKKDKRCPSLDSYKKRFGKSWVALKDAILSKAKDLGINEDNLDKFPLPEPKAERKAKATPRPKKNPKTVSEPSENLDAPTEVTPAPIIDRTDTGIALPSIFTGLSAEPIMSSEVEPEGNKLISLYPQTRITSPAVEGYASVYITNGAIPLNRTVLGVPVSQKQTGLSLVMNGKVMAFPDPQDGIFYIVERKIASSARDSGRTTCDLLIPEKYSKDMYGMKITEFSIL